MTAAGFTPPLTVKYVCVACGFCRLHLGFGVWSLGFRVLSLGFRV